MKFVKLATVIILLLIIGISSFRYLSKKFTNNLILQKVSQTTDNLNDDLGGEINNLHPLTVESLRNTETPGSDLVIEQTLDAGTNYDRYVASYKSDGLKIFGLLTIPRGTKPESGWPVVVFNHGYIAPQEYRTTDRYVDHQDGFARNDYITFKSDYRGHGSSEGTPTGAYGSNSYTVDVLNAVSSLRKRTDVDKNRVGMWGHSLGGYLTLRAMVVDRSIKAGVIWGGVVGSYSDLLNNWRRPGISPFTSPPGARASWRQTLVEKFGTPDKNPTFWNSISANSYLKDISGPVQLHHGTADSSVRVEFSEKLDKQLKTEEKISELYVYEGDDHNLTNNFNTAMQRSIEFFDRYVKNSK